MQTSCKPLPPIEPAAGLALYWYLINCEEALLNAGLNDDVGKTPVREH